MNNCQIRTLALLFAMAWANSFEADLSAQNTSLPGGGGPENAQYANTATFELECSECPPTYIYNFIFPEYNSILPLGPASSGPGLNPAARGSDVTVLPFTPPGQVGCYSYCTELYTYRVEVTGPEEPGTCPTGNTPECELYEVPWLDDDGDGVNLYVDPDHDNGQSSPFSPNDGPEFTQFNDPDLDGVPGDIATRLVMELVEDPNNPGGPQLSQPIPDGRGGFKEEEYAVGLDKSPLVPGETRIIPLGFATFSQAEKFSWVQEHFASDVDFSKWDESMIPTGTNDYDGDGTYGLHEFLMDLEVRAAELVSIIAARGFGFSQHDLYLEDVARINEIGALGASLAKTIYGSGVFSRSDFKGQLALFSGSTGKLARIERSFGLFFSRLDPGTSTNASRAHAPHQDGNRSVTVRPVNVAGNPLLTDKIYTNSQPNRGPSTAATTGDPIDVARGEFVYSKTDYYSKGRGPSLSLTRHYSSRHLRRGILGPNWSMPLLETSIVVWPLLASGEVLLEAVWGDGNRSFFTQDPASTNQDPIWRGADGELGSIVSIQSDYSGEANCGDARYFNGYIYRSPSGSKMYFCPPTVYPGGG